MGGAGSEGIENTCDCWGRFIKSSLAHDSTKKE
jgi:hypothetical protein